MNNSSTAIKTVPFHGHDLITIQDGETVRVAMKPICDAIGLQWEAQLKRIKRHPALVSSMSMMDTVAEDGKKRELVTLPLAKLNGWLFGVDANRVKPGIRERLIEYQEECFDALADYWQKGVAINPRIPLTPNHQRELQKAIASRVYAQVPKDQRPAAFKKLYGHLKDRFGVAKYDQIPDEQYTEALGAIESYTFSGDFLEAAGITEPKPVKQIGLDEWLGMNYYIASRQMDQNRVMITARSLIDSEYRSPCMHLIKELETEGHSLEACRLEIASLRHHLESAVMKLDKIATAAQGVNVQAVSFSR